MRHDQDQQEKCACPRDVVSGDQAVSWGRTREEPGPWDPFNGWGFKGRWEGEKRGKSRKGRWALK